LLRLVAKGVRPDQPVPAAIGRVLRSYSQSAAERLHGRTRRLALAEEQRLNKSLGFAGTE
jgi:preprotein translocase subunit SecA